jgi:hypothetical protein
MTGPPNTKFEAGGMTCNDMLWICQVFIWMKVGKGPKLPWDHSREMRRDIRFSRYHGSHGRPGACGCRFQYLRSWAVIMEMLLGSNRDCCSLAGYFGGHVDAIIKIKVDKADLQTSEF